VVLCLQLFHHVFTMFSALLAAPGEEIAMEGLRQRGNAKAPEAVSEAKGEDRCPISGKQGAQVPKGCPGGNGKLMDI
jgi:hypothetical protein